ncbi:MAG TPA: RluA family pseudouridine synthase [Chloroflexia bacterium]|nr:RluA family pseudouridine synthase [Chloroflexia bacterium]
MQEGPKGISGVVEWHAGPEESGRRLDTVLSERVESISRSYGSTLIDAGNVLVNGERPKPSYKVRAGDLISAILPAPAPSSLTPETIPLSILYEDSDLLVVDKPAGMVVHPAPGHTGGTLVNALLAHVPGIELDMGDEARPGIVHRLDKDTSGLLVVAKRRPAHEALSRQMSERTMHKEYLALVSGKPRPPDGVIDAPIARDPRDRQRMAVVSNGRHARTHYATVRTIGAYSLLRVTLDTGRTHQIRVHMASIGYPIAGDPVYGKRTLKEASALGLSRQFLHAHKLGFTLPSSGEWLKFVSPLPADLQEVLSRIAAVDE